jgi:UDP-N-acetylmuramate dehydrogenase
MNVESNLTIPNTFALRAEADRGCIALRDEDIREAHEYAAHHDLPISLVGEGSNILPRAQVHRFVCVIRTRGIEVVAEDAEHVFVRVAAGENWHAFVMRCLTESWFGLENLALIPGSVGAAPVQNIGAYGVEVARSIECLEVLTGDGERFELNPQDCDFRYRDSVFKRTPHYAILNVTFRLNKVAAPVHDYPELQHELDTMGHGEAATPKQVAQAVISIRQRKLPAPDKHPNVGSFFKNPIVPQAAAVSLQQRLSGLQMYAVPEVGAEVVKLSAAQLIDRAGWKSKPAAHIACWPQQPLVLVNTGGASDDEVFAFAAAIQADIKARYGVELELEPSLLS